MIRRGVIVIIMGLSSHEQLDAVAAPLPSFALGAARDDDKVARGGQQAGWPDSSYGKASSGWLEGMGGRGGGLDLLPVGRWSTRERECIARSPFSLYLREQLRTFCRLSVEVPAGWAG